MSDATLEALRKISHTLHDAGWAEPETSPPPLTEARLEQLRRAYARSATTDDLQLMIQLLLGETPLSEVERSLNRDPAELGRLVSKAIRDLNAFTSEAASALSGQDDARAGSGP